MAKNDALGRGQGNRLQMIGHDRGKRHAQQTAMEASLSPRRKNGTSDSFLLADTVDRGKDQNHTMPNG